jgi:4-coumarate--CoA ligase
MSKADAGKNSSLTLPAYRTTGLPKGVDISHYGLVANAVQTNYVMDLDPRVANRELSAQHSRWLCCIPLYHGLGLCYFTGISASRRVPTYIMRQFELDKMLNHIQRFRITELHLVPPIIVGMTKHAGVRSGAFDLSSVTKTFSCAAPLGPEPTRQYEALWPPGVMNVKQGLASSEYEFHSSLTFRVI